MSVKIILELKNQPQEGDVLVFDGTHFECINKNVFLRDLTHSITEINSAIGDINDALNGLDARLRIQEGEE